MKTARKLTTRLLKRTMSVAEMARKIRDIRIFLEDVTRDPMWGSLGLATQAHVELGIRHASMLPSEIEGLLWHRKRRRRQKRHHTFHRKLIV